MTEIITSEEKLEYIYQTLKKNQKKELIGSIFKWIYRITIVGYLYYFFMISLPAILDKIPSFTHPGENMNMKEIISNPQIKGLIDTYFNK